MDFSHESIMVKECIDALELHDGGIYMDLTCGGGGHSSAILEILSKFSDKSTHLYCSDRDDDALNATKKRLERFSSSLYTINKSKLSMIDEICEKHSISAVDGILLDLGVSSYQLDESSRGFSYQHDGPLDMRMSTEGVSAYDLVNTLSAYELSRIIFMYGEEKYAKKIAYAIIKEREKAPIKTTGQLSDLIKQAVPWEYRNANKHPAKRTFQALRIAVNNELDELSIFLDKVVNLLAPKGKLCIITFHSLEDRIVKQAMNLWENPCTCPPDFPICTCGKTAICKHLTKKAIAPSDIEISKNPRARSALLRVARRLV